MVQSGAEEKLADCTGASRTLLSSSLSGIPPTWNVSMSAKRAENRPAYQSLNVRQKVPRCQ